MDSNKNGNFCSGVEVKINTMDMDGYNFLEVWKPKVSQSDDIIMMDGTDWTVNQSRIELDGIEWNWTVNQTETFGFPEREMNNDDLNMCYEQFENMLMSKREEEKMYYNLYKVLVVDKESLEVIIDEKVIAKSAEQAMGKTGYFKLLAEKDYDTSKFEGSVEALMVIKKVEKDKEE